MWNFIWPIALVVLSNTLYQVCAKGVPGDINPFASLTITYLVGAGISGILYLVFSKGGNIFHEFNKLNWAPILLGLVIVGLEAGWIFAYKQGWQVSTASIVQCSFLAIVLIFVGWLLYKEPITWNKLVGIGICMVGLGFINYK